MPPIRSTSASQPAVSVVMPVFNAADTVAAAARSVLRQTYENLELVIIDDGSTDGSPDVVASLDDPRVRLLRAPHRGIVPALNDGVAAARAPIIARMDADDRAHPDRLALQLDRLAAGDVAIVGCGVRIVDAAGEPIRSMARYEAWINSHRTPAELAAMRFVESPLVHPTVTARREVFELGYREGPFPEDYDLWLRAIHAGFAATKLPDILLDWIDRTGRLTRSHPAYSREAFDRCRREHLLAGPLREVTQVDLWGAGDTGKPWQRWLGEARVAVRRLFDVSPRKLGQRIHGVTVEPPDAIGPADGTPLLGAVGAAGARELMRPHLEQRGYVVGRDVWFVA